jgi:putative N6-adenine-specific DNA methylase
MSPMRLFLPCAGGVETLLAEEVQRILGPGAAVESGPGGVWAGPAPGAGEATAAALRTAMRLNLHSRIAQRVLWPVAEGPYRDAHDLYALARSVRWEDWITPAQTLRIDVSARHSPLPSLNFAVLRIKDAVCDRLREVVGDRPSVDTRRPDLSLLLFVGPERATLSIDTSGEPLFKRGWRDARGGREAVKGEAPLKETLAAAMLAAAGWQGRAEDGPLLDPCCGAGTVAIEAAQLACGIAPGSRRRFGFERLRPFADLAGDWRELQAQAAAAVHAPAAAVFAGDVSFRMTDFATHNAERAGVAGAIAFKTADATQRPPPAAAGTLLMNPPYGERMAAKGSRAAGERRPARARDEAGRHGAGNTAPEHHPEGSAGHVAGREGFEDGSAAFYAALAAQWKRHYGGWTAWLLSPQRDLPRMLRLKESRRVPMFNGAIECRLWRFSLVSGSNRPDRADRPGGDDAPPSAVD